jgi:hypothetical protein
LRREALSPEGLARKNESYSLAGNFHAKIYGLSNVLKKNEKNSCEKEIFKTLVYRCLGIFGDDEFPIFLRLPASLYSSISNTIQNRERWEGR